MTYPLARPFSGPMERWPDASADFDRGPMTSGLRVRADTRTHIDRICPYLPGETYAGAGGNAREVVFAPSPVPNTTVPAEESIGDVIRAAVAGMEARAADESGE